MNLSNFRKPGMLLIIKDTRSTTDQTTVVQYRQCFILLILQRFQYMVKFTRFQLLCLCYRFFEMHSGNNMLIGETCRVRNYTKFPH